MSDDSHDYCVDDDDEDEAADDEDDVYEDAFLAVRDGDFRE